MYYCVILCIINYIRLQTYRFFYVLFSKGYLLIYGYIDTNDMIKLYYLLLNKLNYIGYYL